MLVFFFTNLYFALEIQNYIIFENKWCLKNILKLIISSKQILNWLLVKDCLCKQFSN